MSLISLIEHPKGSLVHELAHFIDWRGIEVRYDGRRRIKIPDELLELPMWSISTILPRLMYLSMHMR